MEKQTKKCTNCSRGEQHITQFINTKGRECNTCAKCREKDKKRPMTNERREKRNKLQNEKKYYQDWRKKKREENEEEFKKHNNEIHKEWKQKNPNYMASWNRKSVNKRLDAIKRSAEKRKIAWDLDDEVAKNMLIKPCVYCGHIDLNVRVNGIDRMDSSVPYSNENCVPCCKGCNYMKCEYDPFTFIERCKQIAQCSYEFPNNIKPCLENRFPNKQNESGTQTILREPCE